ncbi:MAG: leucyl aminopeptidase [Euryarchaeota archaeon]|nr:leucyl aminopeptidase [Euryarchaeota archaeon]MDE1880149.1 leucyl aminopeptidase [Euryarchaeota archaeon]
MQWSVDRKEAWETSADVVLLGVLEADKDASFPKSLAADDARSGGLLSAAWTRGEIRGKRGEFTLLTLPGGAQRLGVVGLGASNRYNAEAARIAGGLAFKSLRGKSAKVVAVRASSLAVRRVPVGEALAAFADGAELAGYEFKRYKSSPRPPPAETLLLALGKEHGAAAQGVRKALDRQRIITDTVLWSRDIGNLPPDTATPEFLAEQALSLEKELGLKVTVFDDAQLREMGCGGILAVGGGSAIHPPRMIAIEYPGKGAKPSKTVALVGKGITFDSGGISIKPSLNMADMKFDKSGAVAVLGTMRAIAQLKVAPRVIGVMCCAENVPSGSAYRPSDVVKTFGGKCIEVLNTDAEGRVVLSDGLSWVNATHKPSEIIDLATLTGACVVALGMDNAAIVSTNDRLAADLLKASQATGEGLWRMPLTPVHHEMVKSEVADVKNSTESPPAGTLTAAAFLSAFVGETPWAHLDIAGTAYVSGAGARFAPPYNPGGFNGFGIRLLCAYLTQGA